ncbi:MAG: hypothetical protein QXG01_04440, partial [Candidatus Bathyarchaeia archaeon]
IKYIKRNKYEVTVALIKKDSLGSSLEKSLKRLEKESNVKLIIPYKGLEVFKSKVFKKLEKVIAKYS